MRKIILLSLLVLSFSKVVLAQTFTPGNLVVLRLGDGSTALSNASATVSLVEYTPTGTFVQAIAIPSTGTDKLTNSGSATSEGALTLSADGRYLSFVGYDALAGVSGIASTATNKVVARVGANGIVDLTTKMPNADMPGNNPRGSVTLDGSSFWVCGGAGGVRYVPFGNPSSTNSLQLTTSPTNTRIPQVFNRQLYISSSSGAFCSIASVGTGLPTSGTQTVTVLPGLPTTTTTGSPYAFYLFDLNDAVPGYDVAYIADQASTGGQGLRKYSLVAGSWTLNNTITPTGASGITGLTGAVNAAGNVVLYATFSNSANNAIQALTDAGGYNSNNTGTFASIATAGANYVFRGLAFSPSAFTWTGGTSSDWNISGNWSSAGIPTASASPISIPAGLTNYPDITANTYVANLSLEAAASIKVTGASVVLRNVSQPLVLKSDNTSTAIVGTSTGTIKGSATVERYIPARRAFRFLTPGVTTTSSIKTNWQEGAASSTANPFTGYGTHITGSTVDQTNGFDATLNGAASMFTFSGGVWGAGISNTNATTFNAGDAYRILVRGSRSTDLTTNTPTPSITRLRATGTLYFGDYSPTIFGTLNGYTLIGNPYASPIDWHTVTKTNVAATYYAWDPNMTGTNNRGAYVSYDVTTGFNNLGNSGTSAVNRYIQPGQAVFVQTTGASPILTIKETDKQSNFTNVFRTTTSMAHLTALLYKSSELVAGMPSDGVTVVFDNQFSNSIGLGDVNKMTNPDENIAVQNSNRKLSIDARNVVTNADTVWLSISQMNNATSYVLRLSTEGLGNVSAYLNDNFTGSNTLLNASANTDVPLSITADPSSFAANRFYIVLRTAGALPVSITSLKAFQKNAGVQVEWNTANETSMNAYEVEKSIDGSTFTKAGIVAAIGSSAYNWFDASPINGNNYYRIKLIDKAGTFKYTQVVNVKMGGIKNTFTVVGNPVRNKTVVLQMENAEKGSYSVAVFNNLGQQVASRIINHAGGSATETIALGNVSKGTYQLSIIGSNVKENRTIIVQ